MPNDTIYTIPIHAYLILDSNGVVASHYDDILFIDTEDIESRFRDKILFLNDNFHPQFQFVVCRFDTVHAQPLVNIGNSFYPNFWMRENRSFLVSETSNHEVQVFLNNATQGFGTFPDGVRLSPGVDGIGVMMHEFGHYFGLFHTSWSTFGRDGNNDGCVALYPNNTYVESCDFFGSNPGIGEDCEGVEDGYCTGDLVPDTPVDPTMTSSKCNADVLIEIDGEVVTYEIDYANTMRASRTAYTFFTEGQRERMLSTFLGRVPPKPPILGPNAVDQPDWSVFRQASRDFVNSNLCTSSSTEPKLFYGWSNWNILKFQEETTSFEPFVRANVKCEGYGQGVQPYLRRDTVVPGIIVYNGKMRVGARINNGGSLRFLSDKIEQICDPEGQLVESNLDIFDGLSIQRHILASAEFENPYQYIAADVNNSGSVTTADIVGVFRNILLGEDFVVPKFRIFPELSLHEDFGF